MKNMTCSEIDLNRPATRWCEVMPTTCQAPLDCDARSPEDILDTWTHDLKSAYDRICGDANEAKSPRSGGDVDDGAFPDLLFA